MDRKSFIKNSIMALAISLLPKVLRPSSGEVVNDTGEMEKFEGIIPYIKNGGGQIIYHPQMNGTLILDDPDFIEFMLNHPFCKKA
jgi:hypothetical protein